MADSRHMLPSDFTYGCKESARIYPIPLCHRCHAMFSVIRNVFFSGSANNQIGQLGVWHIFASAKLFPTSLNALSHVFLLSSFVQMKRITARRIIAIMKHLQLYPRLSGQFVRNYVSPRLFSPSFFFRPWAADSSIASAIFSLCSPRPALVHSANFNSVPKHLFPISRIISVLARIKVGRIAARSHSAFLTNCVVLGHWTKSKKPCYAMSFRMLIHPTQISIPFIINALFPKPTNTRFVDCTPKSVDSFLRNSHGGILIERMGFSNG